MVRTVGGATDTVCWVAADLMETLRAGGAEIPCTDLEAALDGMAAHQPLHLSEAAVALWSNIVGGMADIATAAHGVLGLAFWPLLFVLMIPALRLPVRALEHLVEHRGAFAAIVAGVVLLEETDGGVRGLSQDVAIMVAATSFLVLALLPMVVEGLGAVQRHVESVVLHRVVRRLTPAHGGEPRRGRVKWGRSAGEPTTIVARPPRGSLRERFDIAAARVSSFLCNRGVRIGPASRPIFRPDSYDVDYEKGQTAHRYWPAPTKAAPNWTKWKPERELAPAARPEAAEPATKTSIEIPPYRLQDDGFLSVIVVDLNEADGYYRSRIAEIDARISASQAVADVVAEASRNPSDLAGVLALRRQRDRLISLQKDVSALLAAGRTEITAKRETEVVEAIAAASARVKPYRVPIAEATFTTAGERAAVTQVDKALAPLLLSRSDNAQALFWSGPIDGAAPRRLSAVEAFDQLPVLMDTGIARTLRAMAGPRHKQFVKTAYWKIVADFVKHRDGHRCHQCGATESLQVHHEHYRTKGDEWRDLECLSTVCNDCHEDIHAIRHDKASHHHLGHDDAPDAPRPF